MTAPNYLLTAEERDRLEWVKEREAKVKVTAAHRQTKEDQPDEVL